MIRIGDIAVDISDVGGWRGGAVEPCGVPRARVHLETTEQALNTNVDDDGEGIAEEDFEKVFSPFARLEHSRSRDTGGAGLGLAIARGNIRSHGGGIVLMNLPGRGLRVIIPLPRR